MKLTLGEQLGYMNVEDQLEILGMLGLCPADFTHIRRLPFSRAKEALGVLKERAKKAFRKLAPELHPDRNGGNAQKTELFKKLNQLVREIDGLGITSSPPLQQNEAPTTEISSDLSVGTPRSRL